MLKVKSINVNEKSTGAHTAAEMCSRESRRIRVSIYFLWIRTTRPGLHTVGWKFEMLSHWSSGLTACLKLEPVDTWCFLCKIHTNSEEEKQGLGLFCGCERWLPSRTPSSGCCLVLSRQTDRIDLFYSHKESERAYLLKCRPFPPCRCSAPSYPACCSFPANCSGLANSEWWSYLSLIQRLVTEESSWAQNKPAYRMCCA